MTNTRETFERENLKTVLQSELHSAVGYMQRLCHALGQMTDLQHLNSVRTSSREFRYQLREIIESEVLSEFWQAPPPQELQSAGPLKKLSSDLEVTSELLIALIRLQFNTRKSLELVCEVINLIYDHCSQLHQILYDYTELEISYPRINLIEVRDFEYDDIENIEEFEQEQLEQEYMDGPLSFFLDPEKVADCAQSPTPYRADQHLASIDSLDWQRHKNYDNYLSKGHQALYHRRYEDALECFEKAEKSRETAEILTLQAWVHSLLGKNDKAKSLCLKAIRKDPDYGPPYNDLGSYLLNEGELDESLRWFELAKKSPEYQNREYPYINAGRAYMAKKDFRQALEEFNKALVLAPYHDQLQETIDKLKKSLSTSRVRQKFHEDLANFTKNQHSLDDDFNHPTH